MLPSALLLGVEVGRVRQLDQRQRLLHPGGEGSVIAAGTPSPSVLKNLLKGGGGRVAELWPGGWAAPAGAARPRSASRAAPAPFMYFKNTQSEVIRATDVRGVVF